MAYFNEDNVTEQMCIEGAKQAGYEYVMPTPCARISLRSLWTSCFWRLAQRQKQYEYYRNKLLTFE